MYGTVIWAHHSKADTVFYYKNLCLLRVLSTKFKTPWKNMARILKRPNIGGYLYMQFLDQYEQSFATDCRTHYELQLPILKQIVLSGL